MFNFNFPSRSFANKNMQIFVKIQIIKICYNNTYNIMILANFLYSKILYEDKKSSAIIRNYTIIFQAHFNTLTSLKYFGLFKPKILRQVFFFFYERLKFKFDKF